jgi:hypothetical protein
MTLLATLYPAYGSTDFDLETAMESPKRLVITWKDAVQWAKAKMDEGRGEKLEWELLECEEGRWATWECRCNEENSTETWILTVQDVPFAKF